MNIRNVIDTFIFLSTILRGAANVFFVYPAVIIFTGIVMYSGMNTKTLTTEFFTYVSSVSQVAAHSMNHVNISTCVKERLTEPSLKGNSLPISPVICDEWSIKSVLIENASSEAADWLLRFYLLIVTVSTLIYFLSSGAIDRIGTFMTSIFDRFQKSDGL